MNIFIDTYGVFLDVENDMICFRDEKETRKISPLKLTSINILRPCSLTSPVLVLAAEHQIPVLFYNDFGKVSLWTWSHKYGNIADVRIQQVLFCRGNQTVFWTREIIYMKCSGMLSNLSWIINRKPGKKKEVEKSIQAIKPLAEKIKKAEQTGILRSMEAHVAKQYWEVLFLFFDEGPDKRIKKGAEDLINSSLNYGYGILYGLTEASLLMKGLDPYMGIHHVNQHDKPALAFDQVEPFRPWVDRVVLELLFSLSDEERESALEEDPIEGRMILTREYRRRLVEAFFAMMEEKAYLNGKRVKKKDHIHHVTGMLLGTIKKYREDDIENRDV